MLDESFTIQVANCEFKSLDSVKQKLLQFPPSTVFKLRALGTHGDASMSEDVFQQIKSFLKEHGMNVERKPE
jgi:hypothetical protein